MVSTDEPCEGRILQNIGLNTLRAFRNLAVNSREFGLAIHRNRKSANSPRISSGSCQYWRGDRNAAWKALALRMTWLAVTEANH